VRGRHPGGLRGDNLRQAEDDGTGAAVAGTGSAADGADSAAAKRRAIQLLHLGLTTNEDIHADAHLILRKPRRDGEQDDARLHFKHAGRKNPQMDSFWFARIAIESKHKRTIFA
jgi:hypothetical protein